MASCPTCRRPVAVARATCLYCGAPLPAEPAAAVLESPGVGGAPETGRTDGGRRSLVVLDLDGVSADALAPALDLPPYEAGLVARRGGLHLHLLLDPTAAEAEAGRLGARGLSTYLVPEAEARVRPLRATGGDRKAGALALRTEEGLVDLPGGDVLLVVRGPITRAYQASSRRRRIDTARLDDGYRVHLHRRSAGGGSRPVEIDAATFEFGFAATGSARLELDAWTEEVAGGAPCDDGFRRLPPALGPAEAEPKGALAAASSLPLTSRAREGGSDERPLVLDNVEQFRFYSGWRAAVERRRSSS